MLILQRKPDEAVLIGDDIRIVVLQSDGGGVRIGIEAPPEVQILREEIVDQVRSETVRASKLAVGSLEELRPPQPIGRRDQGREPSDGSND